MKIINTTDTHTPAKELSAVIQTQLNNNKKVLWLLSGGSALSMAVEARSFLKIPADTLHVALIDERYGNVGHTDSNWHQLLEAGFDMTNIIQQPVLIGSYLDKTTQNYNDQLAKLLEFVDFSIGIYGIGADGHTSGLLPNNPIMNSLKLVDSYKGPDYIRITTTKKLIPKLDITFVFVMGKAKWPAVKQMLKNGDTNQIPARILHEAHDLTVYTDYKEG